MSVDNPLVSVILPVYNVKQYLPETLECVLNQTLSDLEVIIVDDGSTDGTTEIVRDAERYSQVKTIYHPENRGVAAARNAAVDAAQGRYLAFVDGDDLPHEDMYRSMAAAAESQEAEIVTCGHSRFREGEGERSDAVPLPFRYPPGRRLTGLDLKSVLERGHRDKLYDYNQLYMYNRELFVREGLRFNPSVPLGSDLVFNAEALRATRSLYTIPEHLYVIRHRIVSMSSLGKPDRNRSYSIQYNVLREFYESKGIWSSIAASDYYRHVLEHLIPTGIINCIALSSDRKELRGLLEELRAQDWVSDALEWPGISRGLPFKKLLVSQLLAHNYVNLVSLIYARRVGQLDANGLKKAAR